MAEAEKTMLFTPGQMLTRLAGESPDQIALIVHRADGITEQLTRMELERWANRVAHRLLADTPTIAPGAFVAIHLPNGVEHVVATLAIFKLGACPMPVSHRMPAAERDGLMALVHPAAIFSDAPELAGISRAAMRALDACSDLPPPDAVPQPFKAIASGGSTGKPKLIVSPGAFAFPAGGHPIAGLLGLGPADRLYSPGPLYHNQAFFFTQIALFQGGSAVLNEKFDAALTLDLIEQHRPTALNMVPTMMSRMLRLGGIAQRNFGSVKTLWHLAAACPPWVKQGWIELLGAERVMEMWSSTEVNGATTIRGDEWLQKPGSVGKPWNTEIRILDAERRPLAAGEVGEVFSRFAGGPPQAIYIGAKNLEDIGGHFTSVGDLGYVDADGYLFLADRRVDLIISGGANVVPAEVEAALTQHPSVRDAAVIGLKDDDLGRRVHAIVELDTAAAPVAEAVLDQHVRSLIAGYKIPRSYEFIAALPRDEAGKIRRGALRDARGG
ncbi:MAG: AMP-binding protein [Pseudomonadota bacterium]